jgi:hypothetical protein
MDWGRKGNEMEERKRKQVRRKEEGMIQGNENRCRGQQQR